MRDGEVFIPDGNFKLRIGDRIGITASRTEVQKLLKTIGMPHKQTKNVIILGASRISFYLTKMLINAGVQVKIIERDAEKCASYAAMLPNAVIIMGDGMQREVLKEEGIADTDAFIALTGMDEENILSSISCSEYDVPTIVTKINRPELHVTAERLGLKCIVSPQNTVANVLSRYARALQNSLGSNVETLYKLMDGKAEVLEFKVQPDFRYTKILLRDMKLKNNILIAGIVRGRKPIIPSGDDCILPGDRVIIVAAGHQLGDLSDIIH